MPEPIFHEPQIILDEIAREHAPLVELDAAIRNRPEQIHALLSNLGELSLRSADNQDVHLINDIFSRKLDIYLEFDKETERALTQDTRHQELLAQIHRRNSIVRQTRGKDHRDDQQAVEIRDTIRLERLQTILQRRIEWQRHSRESEQEPTIFPASDLSLSA